MIKTRVMRNKTKGDSIYDSVVETAKANGVKVVCMVDKVVLSKKGKTRTANSMGAAYLTLMEF